MGQDKLIYRVTRSHEHSYAIDELVIMEYSEQSASARLAGAIDNSDGYDPSAPDKGAATAARMARCFQALIDAGHSTFYDWGIGAISIRIRYQVYENADAPRPAYCQPRIDWPDDLSRTRRALRIVEKIGRRVERVIAKAYSAERGYKIDPSDVRDATFKQLQDVTDALDAIGAVHCEKWQAPSDGWYSPPTYYVPA